MKIDAAFRSVFIAIGREKFSGRATFKGVKTDSLRCSHMHTRDTSVEDMSATRSRETAAATAQIYEDEVLLGSGNVFRASIAEI